MTATEYDAIPYDSRPHIATRPDRLATIATLFGMTPAPPTRCRVLELGCGVGNNLIPLAIAAPDSSFLGLDLSVRQIEAGQNVIASLGLGNIELRHANILEASTSLCIYDYIICHGVYSWVPREVQDRILSICRQHLAPEGVAYVSYNTYPGWHFQEAVRNAMCFRGRLVTDLRERVATAREFVDIIAKSASRKNEPYAVLMKQQAEELARMNESYVLHEYLAPVNEPVYFQQFVERVSAHGLQYLAEADAYVMEPNDCSPEVVQCLRRTTQGVVDLQQSLDFVRNTKFHRSLVCQKDVRIDRGRPWQRILGLHIASRAKPKSRRPDRGSAAVEQFGTPDVDIATRDPALKTTLAFLASRWPQAASFGEVAEKVGHERGWDSMNETDERQRLAKNVFDLYFSSPFLDLYVDPPCFTLAVDAHPTVSRLAREQASRGPWVTNQLHQSVELTPFEQRLITHLDGAHSIDDLQRAFADEIAASGIPLARHLKKMARQALLVSDAV